MGYAGGPEWRSSRHRCSCPPCRATSGSLCICSPWGKSGMRGPPLPRRHRKAPRCSPSGRLPEESPAPGCRPQSRRCSISRCKTCTPRRTARACCRSPPPERRPPTGFRKRNIAGKNDSRAFECSPQLKSVPLRRERETQFSSGRGTLAVSPRPAARRSLTTRLKKDVARFHSHRLPCLGQEWCLPPN